MISLENRITQSFTVQHAASTLITIKKVLNDALLDNEFEGLELEKAQRVHNSLFIAIESVKDVNKLLQRNVNEPEIFDEDNPEILETHSIPRESKYKYDLGDGRFIQIGRANEDFFEQIRALPVHIRIILMVLKPEEMEKSIAESRKEIEHHLLELIDNNWYWKESGVKLFKSEDEFPLFDYKTLTQIRRKVHSLPLELLIKLTEWFENDNSEVYIPE